MRVIKTQVYNFHFVLHSCIFINTGKFVYLFTFFTHTHIYLYLYLISYYYGASVSLGFSRRSSLYATVIENLIRMGISLSFSTYRGCCRHIRDDRRNCKQFQKVISPKPCQTTRTLNEPEKRVYACVCVLSLIHIQMCIRDRYNTRITNYRKFHFLIFHLQKKTKTNCNNLQ